MAIAIQEKDFYPNKWAIFRKVDSFTTCSATVPPTKYTKSPYKNLDAEIMSNPPFGCV